MAETLAVRGAVRPRSTGGSVAGYVVKIGLQADMTVGDEVLRHPVQASARLVEDGAFDLAVEVDGTPVGPVELSISAPTGAEVLRQQVALEQLAKPLRLRISTVDPVVIVPSEDPGLGARVRITGQVVDRSGQVVPPQLPVVISGVARADGEVGGGGPAEGGNPSAAQPLV